MNKRIIFPGLYIQRKRKDIKTQSEVNFYMILKIYHKSTKIERLNLIDIRFSPKN